MIYLDNAATSWPKPAGVAQACENYLKTIGASPGRSGHQLAAAAGRMVFKTRQALARLFNLNDPGRIVFTQNATMSLNLALFGLLRQGDRVLTSALEHNAVMRPLQQLRRRLDLEIDFIPANSDSHYNLEEIKRLCAGRDYRLAVINHGSNVIGSLAPLDKILPILRKHGIISIVDGAQSAGAWPIDLAKLDPDIFCFTGHKCLLGPPGTGGLYLRPGCSPEPLVYGGTGSRSETELQPDFLPDRYESGTLNSMGLAGLKAGVEFILDTGLEEIAKREKGLGDVLRNELREIPGVTVHGALTADQYLPVVSLTIEDLTPSAIGQRLDREFGIMTRIGLHCAPRAHQTIGSFPDGTVRLAPGWSTTDEEIEKTIQAIREIADKR